MTSKLTRLLVGAAMGAGAIGVILALAGVHSPVRTALVLLFLAVAPTAAIAGLLRSFDPFARLVLSVVSTLAVLSIVAMILLAAGLWSPTGELLIVAAITVICLAAQRPSVRARVAAWAKPRWQAMVRRMPRMHAALTAPAKDAAAETGATGAAAAGAGGAETTAEVAAAGAEAGTADATAEVAAAGAVVAAGNGHATAGNGAAVAGNGAVVAGNGQPVAGNSPTAPQAAEAETPATGPADADTAQLPRPSDADTVVLDRIDLDEAGTTPESGTGTGGPTEITSPLPAIRD